MRKENFGFTLIELLVAMLLMGILLSIAVPSGLTMLKNGRLSAAGYALISDINLARSEAVRTGQRVVLCPADSATSDGCRLTMVFGGNAEWQDSGWLVGIDHDRDLELDTGFDEPLSRRNDIANGVKVKSPSDAALWFYPDGSVRDINGQRTDASFSMCSSDANTNGRSIEINRAGSARIEQTDIVDATLC